MTSSNLRAGRRPCSRNILLAAAASAASLLSSVAMAAVVTSPISNIVVPQNVDGVYINVVTGVTGTSAGAVAGFDLNPFLTAGNLGIYWGTVAPPAPAPTRGGGVAATLTGPLLVLNPGDTIGPTSVFNAATGATAPSFRLTQTGFMGIRFQNEVTGALNFGYMQISTTAATGFPATVISIVYEDTGAAITIPLPAVPPQFAYTPASGQPVQFSGGAIGTSGSGSVAVTLGTAGVGMGAAATTTTTCTAPSAPFSGFGQSVTAIGTGAITGGPLSGTCVLGGASVTQTLTCNESRGGAANARTFTLTCPAGTPPPPAFIPTNNVWTLALMGLLMSLLAGIAVVRRQG